ncbi:uncharacterized protein [Palaemon carinicauda]|uniref:uncharacterized protein isoform X2 n=1 Tax=Palaemon carinicauda TaxID=392227 RepID=UPI0035B6A3D2
MEDLEEISDTATENGREQDNIINDDGPEEGEISDDEITIERVVKPSEVVIYDDLGRTAIFTSPKKNEDNWARGVMEHYTNYCDAQESARRNSCTRKKKSYRDMGSKSKRSSKTLNKHISRHKGKAPAVKEHSKHRSPSSSSESVKSSGSTCSCSCSTSSCGSSNDVLVISPPRGRGKENKLVSQADRREVQSAGVSHFQSYLEEHYHKRESKVKKSSEFCDSLPEKDHSSPRKVTRPRSPSPRKEVTRQSSPPIYGRMKHSKPSRAPVRSVRPPSRNLKTPAKSTHAKSKSRVRERSIKGRSERRKESGVTSKKVSHSVSNRAEEIDLTLGDNSALPPPGSLGEMLLRKTKRGKLKVPNNSGLQTSKESAKERNETLTQKAESVDPPVINVDEYDDEGETSKVLKDMITAGLDDEDEDELQLRLIALKSSLKILSDVRKENRVASQKANLEAKDSDTANTYAISDTEYLALSEKPCSPSSLEGTLLECIFKRDAAGEFEWRENQRGESVIKENTLGKAEQKHRENVEDLSDSNQDIIDMEICDSSPEDENFEDVDEVLKEVGEDIALDDDILIGRAEENTNRDGYQQNFQIPVEWAYMMPPPPPPDQPDNDINNIDNWCYDQNMYLQSMQSNPANSSEQEGAIYDATNEGNVNWGHNSQKETDLVSYDPLEDQANDLRGKEVSIFCQEQSTEIENDLTSNLLNLPKASGCIDNWKKGDEDAALDGFNHESSLKDQAAHKYQAFMNAVLQNHSSQGQISSGSRERNLLEVNLTKSPSKKVVNQDILEKNLQNVKITNNGRTLIKVNTDCKITKAFADQVKISRAAAKKRRKKRWKKLAKQKQKVAKEKLLIEHIKATLGDASKEDVNIKSNSSHPDDDDEDLLRAQLLIDLSKKKLQKEENLMSANVGGASASGTECNVATRDNSPLVGSIGKKLDLYENSSPCSYPSSAESSPKIRSVSGYALSRRIALQRTKVGKEGSPTHTLRLDSRHLSDIGGYGLDPKHSRYDFTLPYDLNLRKDTLKIKFPPIKPVIINMGDTSSSDDDYDDAEEEPKVKAGCSKTKDSPGTSSGGGKKDTFSSSLDSLLKCMRAKTSGDTSKNKSRLDAVASESSGQTSTPLAVRHLSRTKQEEYHRLKKQLMEKERLQLERQQQFKKATDSKMLKDVEVGSDTQVSVGQDGLSIPLQDSIISCEKSQSIAASPKNTSDDNSGKERAVNFHDKAVIQVQIPNINADSNVMATAVSVSEDDTNQSVCDRPPHVSEDEDDEEALRLMVLKSIPKKTPQQTGFVKLDKECNDKVGSANSQPVERNKGLVEIKDTPVESKSETELGSSRKRSLETKSSSNHPVKVLKAEEKPEVNNGGPSDGNEIDSQKEGSEKSEKKMIVSCNEPVIQGNVPEGVKSGTINTRSPLINKATSSKVNIQGTNKGGALSVNTNNKKSSLISKKAIEQDKQKLEMWNNLKNEYVRKRGHTNEVILQLTLLVQQAAEEENKRKSTKEMIVKLRSQLSAMEGQFEAQSRNLRNKMEKVRKLQFQMTEDCKFIKELEAKGEALGKEVKGIDSSLPRIFDFSKSKQTLANSLSSLRQQMRDVCNKSKANLQAATASTKLQGKGKGAAGVTGIPIGKHKTTIKTSLQDVSSSQAFPKLSTSSPGAVKRKATSTVGPAIKKLTKNKEGIDPKQPIITEVMSKTDKGERSSGTKEAENRSSVIAQRKKLDEMNELCPYDLLGRCNDDSCVYQHLAQPQVERLPCVVFPSSSNMVKTVQSIDSDKGISKQSISLKNNLSPDNNFLQTLVSSKSSESYNSQQTSVSSKSTSENQKFVTCQGVDSASLSCAANEKLSCFEEKLLQRERDDTIIEECNKANFEGKNLGLDKAAELAVDREDLTGSGKSSVVNCEASDKSSDSQGQMSGCDNKLSLNVPSKSDNPIEDNKFNEALLPIPSSIICEESGSLDNSCNTYNNVRSCTSLLGKFDCEVQSGSVSSDIIYDNSTTVMGSLNSKQVVLSEVGECSNISSQTQKVLVKKELEVEQKNDCSDALQPSVGKGHNSDLVGCDTLGTLTVSADDPLPRKSEEGDTNCTYADCSLNCSGDIRAEDYFKQEPKSQVHECTVDDLRVDEESKLCQIAEDTDKHEDNDKVLNSTDDDEIKGNNNKVRETTENMNEVNEDRNAHIGDSRQKNEFKDTCDKFSSKDEAYCASYGETHCPKVLNGNSIEVDESHCDSTDQNIPAEISNGTGGDLQGSKTDHSSTVNSEVKPTLDTGGRQTRQRQQRPSISNRTCRRGRSRNSMSNSNAASSGDSSKGKARGGKKQVATRTRKARGRAPGGRRGAR